MQIGAVTAVALEAIPRRLGSSLVVVIGTATTVAVLYITVRGVGSEALTLRSEIHVVAGRLFEPGRREVIVGRALEDRLGGLSSGSSIALPDGDWKVVGICPSNQPPPPRPFALPDAAIRSPNPRSPDGAPYLRAAGSHLLAAPRRPATARPYPVAPSRAITRLPACLQASLANLDRSGNA